MVQAVHRRKTKGSMEICDSEFKNWDLVEGVSSFALFGEPPANTNLGHCLRLTCFQPLVRSADIYFWLNQGYYSKLASMDLMLPFPCGVIFVRDNKGNVLRAPLSLSFPTRKYHFRERTRSWKKVESFSWWFQRSDMGSNQPWLMFALIPLPSIVGVCQAIALS